MSRDENVAKLVAFLTNHNKRYVTTRSLQRKLNLQQGQVSDAMKVLQKEGIVQRHNPSKNHRRVWEIKKREYAH